MPLSLNEQVRRFIRECQRTNTEPTRERLQERFPDAVWKTLCMARRDAVDRSDDPRFRGRSFRTFNDGLPFTTEGERRRIAGRIKAAGRLKERGIWPAVRLAWVHGKWEAVRASSQPLEFPVHGGLLVLSGMGRKWRLI